MDKFEYPDLFLIILDKSLLFFVFKVKITLYNIHNNLFKR